MRKRLCAWGLPRQILNRRASGARCFALALLIVLIAPGVPALAAPPAAPVVAGFTGVEDGAALRGRVAIQAQITGEDVARVEFELRGPRWASHTESVPPYTFLGDIGDVPIGWDTTEYPDGDYVLTATAFDAAGRSSARPVRFRIQNTAQVSGPPAAAPAPAARRVFGPLPGRTVVALEATPHLWVADEQGVLHWGGDTRALDGRDVDWSSRVEATVKDLRNLRRGDPWLSAGLLKDGDPIYLMKWEAGQVLPRRLRVQSIADLELFGIDASNYGRFVLDRATWQQQYGISVDELLVGELEQLVPAPAPSGARRFTDAFSDRNGTALRAYNGAWTVAGSVWEIYDNAARMRTPGESGAAVVDLGSIDQEIAVTITLPATTARYPTDWFAGVFARYVDGDHHIRARYLYQDNSPEVEVWEIADGRGTLLDFVNLGPDALLPGSKHRLRLAVQGPQVTVYHDGTLVAQGRTPFTGGTRAGIGVSDNLPYGQPLWDDVEARALS